MGFRQEVEGGRPLGAGGQHQRAGLGDGGIAAGDETSSLPSVTPVGDLQQRPRRPGQAGDLRFAGAAAAAPAGSPAPDTRRWRRARRRRRHPRDRRRGLLRHFLEQRAPAPSVRAGRAPAADWSSRRRCRCSACASLLGRRLAAFQRRGGCCRERRDRESLIGFLARAPRAIGSCGPPARAYRDARSSPRPGAGSKSSAPLAPRAPSRRAPKPPPSR